MYPLKRGLIGGYRVYGLLAAMVLLALGLSLALPQAAASAPGTWTYTAETLATARRNHTATLLPNGKVLVVGGRDYLGNIFYDSVELFDPAAGGTWETAAPIPIGRAFHTATLLPNGKVLVAGGNGVVPPNTLPSFLTSARLYNPDENTWTATGDLKKAMGSHTATLLNSGQVLVFGGATGWGPELYDPAEGTWTYAATAAWRSNHTATLLPDGKVLVAGGFGSNGELNLVLNTAETYDPELDTWTPAAPLHHARENHTATLLPNGKVLVAAGHGADYLNSAELYDPASDTWTDTGSLSEARQEHQAVMLDNRQVLVVGGTGYTATEMASAELYNPGSGEWSATGPLNMGRLWFTATLLDNGQVLAASGYGDPPPGLKNTAELYEPFPPQSAHPAVFMLLLDD